MKFPGMPMKGRSVEQTVTEILTYLRASRITGMVGGRVQETPNGTTLHVIPGKGRTTQAAGSSTLPFEISVTADSLIAAAGMVHTTGHAQEVNTTMTDGTWYFRAKVVIDSSTGDISSTDVLWEITETADSSTDFYQSIASVQIISGVPDASTIYQWNYGPITVLPYGTPTNKWGVMMI